MPPPPPPPKVFTEAEIRELTDQLQKELSDDRLSALNTLATAVIPADSIALADVLLILLESDALPEIRKKAGTILAIRFASLPKYAKALFAALNDSSAEVRGHLAVYFMSNLPRDPIYLPEYLAALKHTDKNVRNSLISYLQYGPFDTAITHEIIGALSDQELPLSDETVRESLPQAGWGLGWGHSSPSPTRNVAICALSSILQQPEQAVLVEPVLIAALKDPEIGIALTAAKALRSLEHSNAEADQIFHTAIKPKLFSSDEGIRREGLYEIGSSPKGGEIYIDRLIELLDGTDGDLYNAVATLGKIGTPAQSAIPHLKHALFTKNRVREIAKALAAMDARDPEIIDWLARQCLGSYPQNSGAIYCAAEGLACFGNEAVPHLIKGLDWDNGLVQSNCIDQLGNIGKDAVAALPVLLQMLRNGGGQPGHMVCGGVERSPLIDALVRVAPDNEDVIDCFRAIAQNANDPRRNYVNKTLIAIGLDAVELPSQGPFLSPTGIPQFAYELAKAQLEEQSKARAQEHAALLSGLTDPDEKVRQAAAATVAPNAVRAFLIDLAGSPGNVRDLALHSLEFLDPSDMSALLLKALPSGGIDDGATLIHKIGTDLRAAVPALLRQVHEGHAMHKLQRDNEFEYRSDVLDALAKIAPDDERVLDCLATLAAKRGDHYQSVSNHYAKAAIAALSSIGSEHAIAIIGETQHS